MNRPQDLNLNTTNRLAFSPVALLLLILIVLLNVKQQGTPYTSF